jgi:hypothetical protein
LGFKEKKKLSDKRGDDFSFWDKLSNALYSGASFLFYYKFSKIVYEGDDLTVLGLASYNRLTDQWDLSKPFALLKDNSEVDSYIS